MFKGLRQLRLFIALSLLLVSAPFAHAQQCVSDLSTFSIGAKYPGSDGKIRIKYGFAAGTPESVKSAATAAFSQWNGHSGTTNVVFELAGPNEFPTIEFKASTDTNQTRGCAGYSPNTDRVYFSPGFEQAAQSSASAGATIIAHEIGHYLGLDEAGLDPATPTIMNNGGAGSCLESAQNVPTKTVQAGDASKVVDCVNQAHNQHVIGDIGGGSGGGYYYEPYYSYDCYERYLVTDYYNCYGDSCTYEGSSWELLGIVCY